MEILLSIEVIQTDNTHLMLPVINHNLAGLLVNDWFEIDFWRQQNAITGESRGRNITWFIGYQDDEWVLRHYYRGGLIAKFLNDQYLYTGLDKTRCYQELALLQMMHQQGLPVPRPIAARMIKKGLFYQSDLLIEKIPHSQDLVAVLKLTRLKEAEWHDIGAMIAKFHEAGVYHADLNAHNILQTQTGDFWLIDFDRCEQRRCKNSWQQSNLNRLHRSFEKEKKRNQQFYFDAQCWQWLIVGYQRFYHLSDGARH